MLAATAACVLSQQVATADAAPSRFFGVHASAPSAADFQRMARGGVRLCRVQVDWASIERSPGSYDWAALDSVVAGAAGAGVELLPFLLGTPSWVSANPARPPIDGGSAGAAWSSFAAQLAGRYGSSGTFWLERPDVPRRPIVVWQLWNETNTRAFWGGRPNAKQYANLVALTARAIRSADPRAELILSGLIPFRSLAPGSVAGLKYLQRLLRFKAIRRFADGVAIHPYGKSPQVVLKWLLRARELLDRSAPKMPLWVSEFGWSTGGSDARRSPVGASRRGQAKRVAHGYRLLARNRKRLKLRAAVYFSYTDIPLDGDVWIGHMGLFDGTGQPKPAWFAYVKRAGGTP